MNETKRHQVFAWVGMVVCLLLMSICLMFALKFWFLPTFFKFGISVVLVIFFGSLGNYFAKLADSYGEP